MARRLFPRRLWRRGWRRFLGTEILIKKTTGHNPNNSNTFIINCHTKKQRQEIITKNKLLIINQSDECQKKEKDNKTSFTKQFH